MDRGNNEKGRGRLTKLSASARMAQMRKRTLRRSGHRRKRLGVSLILRDGKNIHTRGYLRIKSAMDMERIV
jgi:hypothetical protein